MNFFVSVVFKQTRFLVFAEENVRVEISIGAIECEVPQKIPTCHSFPHGCLPSKACESSRTIGRRPCMTLFGIACHLRVAACSAGAGANTE
jgi:hypothetical protein